MIIIYCSEVSSMSKRFEESEKEKMGEYIVDCLAKYPYAEIEINKYI